MTCFNEAAIKGSRKCEYDFHAAYTTLEGFNEAAIKGSRKLARHEGRLGTICLSALQ